MKESLQYDTPRSAGAACAIQRARQLLSTGWVPFFEFLCNSREYLYPARTGKPHAFPKTYTGFPYSSCRVRDKFIGLDVSIDTFLTALDNPVSILHTRDLSDFQDPSFNGSVSNAFLAYGTVCSSLVSYALALPLHRSTHEVDISPEFFKIPDQCTDGLALCDILVTSRANGRTGGHVRLVTGIARDERGHVAKVEISEGWQPTGRCGWFSAKEIADTLSDPKDHYQIFRYRFLDTVSYQPSRLEQGYQRSTALMLNYGDFSNYQKRETVEFYIPGTADTLVIQGEQNQLTIDLASYPQTSKAESNYPTYGISSLKPDRYKAFIIRDKEPSLPVHFIVAALPKQQLTRADGREFSRIALKVTAPDGTPLTRSSRCLYQEDGTLNPQEIAIALTDGEHLIPAQAAVREINGELLLRTSALLTDENGTPVQAFPLEDTPTLFALSAEEGTLCRVAFSNAQSCTPFSLSWKTESFITYQQRLLTPREQKEGVAEIPLLQHDNAFAHFCMFSTTEYGKLSSPPILFVIQPK